MWFSLVYHLLLQLLHHLNVPVLGENVTRKKHEEKRGTYSFMSECGCRENSSYKIPAQNFKGCAEKPFGPDLALRRELQLYLSFLQKKKKNTRQ